MWVTNGKTWYSEDEVAQLKAENERLKAEMQEKVLKMAEAEIEIEKLQTENEKLKAYIVWLQNNSTIKEDNAILDNKEIYDAMLQFPE